MGARIVFRGAVRGMFCLLLLILPWGGATSARAGDEEPVVLVHGFMGWGPKELAGYKYWGGTALDVEAFLRKKGHACHTATVGPISSNHDRACELFAQIRGGRVDYGAEHAETFGHERYGRKYEGFHPEWSEKHPIHLIGHSMGGQTSRMLVELLARDHFGVGSNENWVRSVSTLSTPHRGTTLVNMVDGATVGLAEVFVSWIMAITKGDVLFYDFELDHWGLHRRDDEGIVDFLRRSRKTLGSTRDIASWDLSVEGAKELNERVRTFPTVRYFSYGNEECFRVPGTNRYIAKPSMILTALRMGTLFMGSFEPDGVEDGDEWGLNDGVVNTVSMKGPILRAVREADEDALEFEPGVWHWMGVKKSKNHMNVIGHLQEPLITGRWMKNYYLRMVERAKGRSKEAER